MIEPVTPVTAVPPGLSDGPGLASLLRQFALMVVSEEALELAQREDPAPIDFAALDRALAEAKAWDARLRAAEAPIGAAAAPEMAPEPPKPAGGVPLMERCQTLWAAEQRLQRLAAHGASQHSDGAVEGGDRSVLPLPADVTPLPTVVRPCPWHGFGAGF